MSKQINSYKDLTVWQKSRELVSVVYKITQSFPKSEMFGLTNQIRRATISIPSNIAEGYQRQTKKEYIQFLHIAYGSCAEVETQLILANDIGYLDPNLLNKTNSLLKEVQKMLNVLIRKLKRKP